MLIKNILRKNAKLALYSLLIFSLFACSKSVYRANVQGEGLLSAGMWYTIKGQEIPLLAQAEWKVNELDNKHEAKIAFIFLHGALFAQCTLADNRLTCQSQSNIPQAQIIANDLATLTIDSIFSLQSQQRMSQNNFMHNVSKKEFADIEFSHIEKDKEIKLIVKKFQTK